MTKATTNSYRLIINSLLLFSVCVLFSCRQKRAEKRVLVFSKTEGWRHASIPAGKKAIVELGKENGFLVDTLQDPAIFIQDFLSRYSAVVFLNTTKDVLNHRQQVEFERYIQAGGGFVGVHAATDTEYHWPWYNKLVGAYFESHPSNPNVRTGTMLVKDNTHPSTQHLSDTWERTDEFYNFKSINPDIIPLILLDESSYEGGTNGDFHPMSWYHDFDGGRAFYTNFGHTIETYSEPDFLKHLLGGIEYAIGENLELDYSLAKSLPVPPDNRFVMQVLDEGLNEPAELEVLPDGKVLFTERRGNLRMYDPSVGKSRIVGSLPVYNGQEDGLMGIALDPDFANNDYLYLYYSPKVEEPIQHLSRFVFRADSLYTASEKVILVVDVQRDECCHSGGSVQFGPDGLLYLSTGDDTNPFETGYSPNNELEGRSPWDAQKSSANPNDLRGKILRIRPTPDGSYEIPKGNLFPKDGSKGRPEIYVMGCRNPYRVSIDPKTNYVYWGDVGPDAQKDSTRGPRGYDEVNQARKAGFFGWPLFIADNKAYREVDFASQTLGDFYDPEKPINNSPNNTGVQALPKANPAFIWYPYAASPDFPIVGKGGRNAMAGPVYYHDLFKGKDSQFPKYYDKKLFIYDFMRDWIFAVSMNEDGDLQQIEPFLPDLKLSSPVDMEFGPDGALYLLEYGTRWFAPNADARLIRIDYKEGNRQPIALIHTDKKVGAAPLTVEFSGFLSYDHDEDETLTYEWDFGDGNKGWGLNVPHQFQEPGKYETVLTVTDKSRDKSRQKIEILVGNEPPKVTLDFPANKSFFWKERPIAYQIDIDDHEDGRLKDGAINQNAVAITLSYLEASLDPTEGAQGHQAVAESALLAQGKDLISHYGCIACHDLRKKIQGPAYQDVSLRYQKKVDNLAYIRQKIVDGGSGIWGEAAMPAQAQVPEEDAEKMAMYILSLAKKTAPPPNLPPAGILSFDQHKGLGEGSSYTMQISYTDKGGEPVGPLTGFEEIKLRSPKVSFSEIDRDSSPGVNVRRDPEGRFAYGSFNHEGLAHFPLLDLSYLTSMSLRYRAYADNVWLAIIVDDPDSEPILTLRPEQISSGQYKTVELKFPNVEGFHDLYFKAWQEADKPVSGAILGIQWMYVQSGQPIP